jgi:hypothetical protein
VLALLKLEQTRRKVSRPGWRSRLPEVYPGQFSFAFSHYHAEFWDFVDSIEYGKPSRPFVSCWPRGAGKSTGAEVAAVELGAHERRKYCWYVRSTQDQADKSVENIQATLETNRVAEHYPDMHEAAMSRIGKPKAWRRNRLMTQSGYVLDGMGIDKAVRGVKTEEQRPDLIIFDDIDERHDTPATTAKKIETLTQSIIPAGSKDVVVIFIQNMIIPDGVMAQLVDGRADFLLDRKVSGPYPAVENLAYELVDGKYKVVGGEPTWPEGQGLDIVQLQINTWGLTAFLREAQHDVDKSGGMYDHIEFQYCEFNDVPDIVKYALWVDPAVTSTDNSDSMGIQLDGVATDGKIYRFYSWESVTSPENAIRKAIRKAVEYGASYVGVETDQGGDTWKTVFNWALKEIQEEMGEEVSYPSFKQDKAGAGYGSKVHRGQQMLADYERGNIVHVLGTHKILEKSLRRFPNKPLDLADAAFWAWNDLRNKPKASTLYAFH